MFRAKAKKSAGAGSVQRKRKAAADGDDADDVDSVASAAAAAPVGGGDDDADDEVLQRMRERNAARRGHRAAAGVGSARRVSAAPSATTSSNNSNSSSGGAGSLSFEAENDASRARKTRMQPNLLQDASGDDDDAAAAAPSAGAYSREALAELREQQNVLLRGASEANGASVDVAMDELDGATVVVEDAAEEADDADGEEFIPLGSQLLQARKKRSRVTFGVQEAAEPPPSRLPEIVEVDEVDDDDDDDEGRQWEEDVMRRGGLRAQPAAASPFDAPTASRRAYPTRRRVPSGSLAGVLAKLQRSLEAANAENARAERELARIGAEAALVKERVAAQRAQLLAASDEFEYFQVVEDYVKGLSFCLREKVREVDAHERDVAKLRVENARSLRDADAQRAQNVADALAAVGAIEAAADLPGLRVFAASSDRALPSTGSASADSELAALLQRGFVDRTPAIRQAGGDDDALDVFADAIDEMNSLEHVHARFEDWRAKFPQVYARCFCDLALEKFYAAYVRAELLYWDPLSVCAASSSGSAKPWGFDSFKWRSVLLQRAPRSSAPGAGVDDSVVAALVRDVVLAKALAATTLYFDPFSSLHTRSLCALLEEVADRAGYAAAGAQTLRLVVAEAAAQFVAAAKRVPLVAVGERLAARGGGGGGAAATVADFAAYQLSRFNALLDNALTLFVALPRGGDDADAAGGQSAGFRCVMQVLHQLLAFLGHGARARKTLLAPEAVRTVSQLAASPHLQQQLLAAAPGQEHELQRVLQLFTPFIE